VRYDRDCGKVKFNLSQGRVIDAYGNEENNTVISNEADASSLLESWKDESVYESIRLHVV
jgi:hypothetical protein